MARRGFLGRIADALSRIGDVFTGEPRRARPSRQPPAPPPEPPRPTPSRPPRRRREPPTDPFRRTWNANTPRRTKGSYSDHRAVLARIPYWDEMDEDEQLDFWDSYTRYMVDTKGVGYRLNSLANPFWADVGIHPDDFDWYAWREANHYEHGARV